MQRAHKYHSARTAPKRRHHSRITLKTTATTTSHSTLPTHNTLKSPPLCQPTQKLKRRPTFSTRHLSTTPNERSHETTDHQKQDDNWNPDEDPSLFRYTSPKDGKTYTRSRTMLVEVINGRSRRFFFNPETKERTIVPQWMWTADEDEFNKMVSSSSSRLTGTYQDFVNTARSFAFSVLLPAGYPDSVHNCYTQFSKWQFVETTFNQFIHVLCSQAMLSCIGINDSPEAAAGGAVAIKWIAKDGIAHFSKLFFTKNYAYQLDFRPKTWGFVSEVLFLLGSAFELSTAVLAKYGAHHLFLPIAALGASLQSVAHLAWEATHATFNKYLSLRNNLADVTAKADSQMVMSELLGMTLGLFYIHYFNEPHHLWMAFGAALPLHIGSTFMRLSSLKFGKLSSGRLLQLYNSYVQHRLGPTKLSPSATPADLLSSTGEHIPREIYLDKEKRIEYVKARMERNAVLVQEQEFQKPGAASMGAEETITTGAPVNAPAHADNSSAASIVVGADITLKSAHTANPSTVTTPSRLPSDLSKLQNNPQKLTEVQQAMQQIMSFATPEQFYNLDTWHGGEWYEKFYWTPVYGYPKLELCAQIDQAFTSESELHPCVNVFRDSHYLVNYRPSTHTIYVSYEEECEHEDLMQSLLVATRLAYDIRKHGAPVAPTDPTVNHNDPSVQWPVHNMVREALQWSIRHEDQIKALLAEAEWDTEELVHPDTGVRVYWENDFLQATRPTTKM